MGTSAGSQTALFEGSPEDKKSQLRYVFDFLSSYLDPQAEAAVVPDSITPQATTTSTTIHYIGSLYEKAGTLKTKHVFLGSLRICSIPSSGSINYIHSDHLGSSNLITDSTSAKVQRLEYEPYGKLALSEGANKTDYKFTGKELDEETELYYYGARYYFPLIGRFLTPDTIVQSPHDPQSLNRYTYCRNNPINLIDPTGLSWKSFWKSVSGFFGAIIGTAVGLLTGNPILGIMVYSAIASSGQGGNFGLNFASSFASGMIGLGVGAGVGAFWGGGFWPGFAAASLGGAGAGAASAAILGGDVGLGALAGFAGGTIGYLGGKVWPMGAEVVGAGVSAEIVGGDFGEGALQGGLHYIGSSIGGVLGTPLRTAGEQGPQGGDIVYYKPDSILGWMVNILEGGIFSHTGTMTSSTEMAHSTLETGAAIVNIEKTGYSKRQAYIDTRFRGNQAVINAAKALAQPNSKIQYGVLPGQKICSTFNAAVLNQAGYKGWHGIGPNSQAPYNQFHITRTYGNE